MNAKLLYCAAALAAGIGLAAPSYTLPAFAEMTKMVGGAAMYPSKNIIENAVNSKDHTTLVAAVKAAGLVDTLEGAGPFTVFAPTNEAFARLPAGTVDTLLKPENKQMLTTVLTLPARFNIWINCAPTSAPPIVPIAMISPSFRSMFPKARCFFAATMDLPTI